MLSTTISTDSPIQRVQPLVPATTAGPPASLTATSWFPHAELPISDWVEQGRWLGAVGRASGWWIGDWVRYGNARYGDKYGPAAQLTGYDVQSLMNMAYVAGRFERTRRREALSFSHHAEVAGLAPEDQDLWLDRAEARRFSVRSLRAELRAARHRVAARIALSETRDPPEPELVCPECGHQFAAARRR